MKKNILLYTLLSESEITTWYGVGINTKIFVNKNNLAIMEVIGYNEKIKLNNTDDYYICNYGWSGFEKVFLMSPIFGSVNFLKIDN
ncbi:hypothetical protein [Mycoplasma anserisalpingitidis]|uniref:Uncharacterized protein n=1 Tax=Mycoplasma anserisalpingitidis TaxID=519450 RepID=A0A5B8K1C2_9MOLU|nr:hypothetical protein [Mycoplasma anserisalpingitidis]QDY88641.1 hypothetical protein FOY43_03185 [Mycoplasma anserisalpingitidis]